MTEKRIDWMLGRRLVVEGFCGADIAIALNCTPSAIHYFAKREGLSLPASSSPWRWRPAEAWQGPQGSRVLGAWQKAGQEWIRVVRRVGDYWQFTPDAGGTQMIHTIYRWMPLPGDLSDAR